MGSFAPSIKQALNALPIFYTGEDNFIDQDLPKKYYERKKHRAIIPSGVVDVYVSKERRVLGNINVKLVGKVFVTTNESKGGWKIHTMRSKVVTFFE